MNQVSVNPPTPPKSPSWLAKILDDPETPEYMKDEALKRYAKELKKQKREVGTKAIESTYQNRPVFQIWKVDGEGKVVGATPLIGFGIIKAKAIANHIDDLKRFVVQHA